jgi:hypothetical protein
MSTPVPSIYECRTCRPSRSCLDFAATRCLEVGLRVDDGRVGGGEEPRPAEVDWIELGRPTGPDGPDRRSWRSRWWLLLIPTVIALVVVGAVRHGGTRSASPSTRPSTPAPRVSVAGSAPAAAPVSITRLGHALLDVPAGWEIFGRGPAGVVRIQLAAGVITRTRVPGLAAAGSLSFVVGPTELIIRPSDPGATGYLVPDGRPAKPQLPGALADADAAFPGPDPGHLWVQSGSSALISLVGFDGKPTEVSFPVPAGNGSVSSDNAGGLIFTDYAGAYALRPDGLHRITRGALLAAGRTRWLVAECDDQHHCATIVIDRARGSRRVLGPVQADESVQPGVISPDGTTAALLVERTSLAPSLYLLDLTSGSASTVAPADGPCNQQSFEWSPDSHWLFDTSSVPGDLCLIDRHTGQTQTLPAALPLINQLSFRNTPR